MSDIALVIKISEEIYNHTQEYEVGGFNQENDTKLFMAIKNGTPLNDIKIAVKRLQGYNPENYDIESDYFGGDRLVFKSQIFEILDNIGKESEEE